MLKRPRPNQAVYQHIKIAMSEKIKEFTCDVPSAAIAREEEMKRNWPQRKQKLAAIFDKPDYTRPNTLFAVGSMRNTLNIPEMENFPQIGSVSRNTAFVDNNSSLQSKPDQNITELVRILGGLDLRVVKAGGGNIERKEKPYLDLETDQLKRVVAILSAWEKAGGEKYSIRLMGRYVEVIRVNTVPEASVKDSIRDIDKLTDFLTEKTGGIPVTRLTLPELTQKVKRRIKGLIKV